MIAAHTYLHGFELLFLIVVEQSLDAVVCAFRDGAGLCPAVFGSDGLVLEEGLHLLLTFYEQRLDLRLLIRGQVEFAGEVLELAIGVHAHAAPARALRWRSSLALIGRRGWSVVLGEGGTTAAEYEQAAEGQSCESTFHIGCESSDSAREPAAVRRWVLRIRARRLAAGRACIAR